MSQLVCLLAVLSTICIDCIYSKCSFYQSGGVSFPTDKCINSTLVNNDIISGGYHCSHGLFVDRIYYYEYSKPNCQGLSTTTLYGTCSLPACNCDVNDSPSQCTVTTFSYNSNLCAKSNQFNEQNLTIITDQCINGKIYFVKDNEMYYSQYNNVDCKQNGNQSISTIRTCYTVDYSNNHEIDTETDTDTIYVYTTTETAQNVNKGAVILNEYKGLFIVAIMVIGTLCSIGCMMRKYRKKQKNKIGDAHQRNLIQNDGEFNKEGIQNDDFGEEEIEIPGEINIDHIEINEIKVDQNMVDQIVNQYINADSNDDDDDDDDNDDNDDNDDDDNNNDNDDIPAAAYSDYHNNDNNNNDDEDEEFEISEGNEGIEEQRSTDDDGDNNDEVIDENE